MPRSSVADHATPRLDACLNTPLAWRKSAGPSVVWATAVDTEVWTVRVNDFPQEQLYTLLIDGRQIGDFDDWPEAWQRLA